MDEAALRNQLCLAVKQLWTRGMLVGADGLVCVEVHRRRYLATPAGRRRIDLTPNDLVCVDIGGENVHGGSGIPTSQWQPHRNAFQANDTPSEKGIHASVLVEPTSVLALLNRHTDADKLDLGCGQSIPIVDRDDDPALRLALAHCTDVVLRGRGLLVAGTDLPGALNRVERIELAAAIRLAGDRHG